MKQNKNIRSTPTVKGNKKAKEVCPCCGTKGIKSCTPAIKICRNRKCRALQFVVC